ncbi:MAG: chorismate-binding protein [Candidatus Muiribacteriota bacterium]
MIEKYFNYSSIDKEILNKPSSSFSFPYLEFRGKWFDSDLYIKCNGLNAIIKIYGEYAEITADKKINYKISADKLIDKVNYLHEKTNKPVFFLFNYELGKFFQNLSVHKDDVLGYIFIPASFMIEKENKLIKYSFINKNLQLVKNQPFEFIKPSEEKTFSEPDFKIYSKKLKKLKKYIIDGFTYQTNYTERIQFTKNISPYDYYKKLYNIKSFSAFLTLSPSKALISDTPERLLFFDGKFVQTEPVKGTINSKLNNAKNKLLNSSKDLTELAMITDLLRNDISKIIKVNTLKEKFAVLMNLDEILHLYSIVRGELKSSSKLGQIMKQIFPGGSITGVPKKMTMKIIDELESSKRGFYTGSAGLLYNQKFDFNILIRSIFYEDGIYTYGTGGGITHSSSIEDEWDEMLLKASKIKYK